MSVIFGDYRFFVFLNIINEETSKSSVTFGYIAFSICVYNKFFSTRVIVVYVLSEISSNGVWILVDSIVLFIL